MSQGAGRRHVGERRNIERDAAGDRVALDGLARRAAIGLGLCDQRVELVGRQEIRLDDEAVALERGAIGVADQMGEPRPPRGRQRMRQLDAAGMQAELVQLAAAEDRVVAERLRAARQLAQPYRQHGGAPRVGEDFFAVLRHSDV
ncbi:MAG: hypothetical protein WDO24_00060 [Pseudomonadota bacterium]